jgi:DNA-binding MarR family transcriptional regulator
MSRLQAEIRQSKPFGSLEEEALLALARTNDQLQRHYDEFFKPYHLTGTQYNALRILRGAGEAGLPCTEIAERMINRDPDITRLLARLEQRGFCTRVRDDNDRRVIFGRITPAGLKLLREIDQPIQALSHRLVSHMGEGALRSLIRLLDKIRDSSKQATIPAQ